VTVTFSVKPPKLDNIEELRKILLRETWVGDCIRIGFVDTGEANADIPSKYLKLKTMRGTECDIYYDKGSWLVRGADKNTVKLLTLFFKEYGYTT